MKQLWNWKNYQIAWKVEEAENDSEIAIVLIHGFGAYATTGQIIPGIF